ncbi:SubName: Full=Probable NADH-ubiquinone oxidoreductase 21 kDa subunit, mitochondrial {ECO:0000313/EMBL:CCA67646.1} [Serendipita indica DSM 11827]|nr:SubName: Full=Probable NADH-ubiquinone oxidoreductase 21 kDa subunit, mitochondrial {ECO:0000313/EMBL:CCA67646.1} [Serendipita indica DSM 11827]
MSSSFLLRTGARSSACRMSVQSTRITRNPSLAAQTTLGRRMQASDTKTPRGVPESPKTTGTAESVATIELGATEISELFPPGSQPAAYECSGAPVQLLHRAVKIYQPTRNTMQSGGAKGEKWRIDWDTLPGAGRWENPLMGWASSADYMQGTRMSFDSAEDAIKFAEKQGWDYYVQPPTVKRIPPKNYAENYVYKPNKLRIARTK